MVFKKIVENLLLTPEVFAWQKTATVQVIFNVTYQK
jgi:hypothetical protein